MNTKEVLYEISLKFNTLKMYDNTIEQMKKNGNTGDSLKKIENERKMVEDELNDLLSPENDFEKDGYRTNPKIDENKFIQEANRRAKYKKLYDIREDFFDNINKPTFINQENEVENRAKLVEYKRPTYADIQDKISNSQWISLSNFIVRLPKDKIDIDSWRVSGFFYTMNRHYDDKNKSFSIGGNIHLIANDFSELKDDGTYNVLSNIIEKLYIHKNEILGDFYLDVINNNGDLLYTICFKKCVFTSADADAFSYESTSLRKMNLNFSYDSMKTIMPNEKIRNEATN